MNKHLLNNFNNNSLQYDKEKYPFDKYVLSVIQEDHPYVVDLSKIHTHNLSGNQILKISEKVQKSFSSHEFGTMIDSFASEYLQPLIGDTEFLVKRYPTLNFVVPNQEEIGRRLPFHQGVTYDNGRGQGTIWMPLTPTFDSNSMYVVDHESSKKITTFAIINQITFEEWERLCLESSYPIKYDVGFAHLFHQEIIHGNVNNVTDNTRMAIDWHILLKDEEFGCRIPGGFFRKKEDFKEATLVNNSQQSIIYISSNSEYDKNIVKIHQYNMIKAYCDANNIEYNFKLEENDHFAWLPYLESLMEHDYIGTILMLSIFSLPDDKERRSTILHKAVKNKKKIVFANEMQIIENLKDIATVEYYRTFAVKKKGKYYWE